MNVKFDIVGNVDENKVKDLRNQIDEMLNKFYITYKINWSVVKGNEE